MIAKKDVRMNRWEMFTDFFDNFAKEYGLCPEEAMLWIVIFRHTDENGETSVSRQQIQRKTGIKSVKTLNNVLNRLIEQGFISVKQGDPSEQDWTLNLKLSSRPNEK